MTDHPPQPTPEKAKIAPGKQPKWRKALLLIALLILAAFTALCLRIDSYGQRDFARPAQAIIILGARVEKNNLPGDSLQARTEKAVMLYKRNYAAAIICTGGLGDNPPSEALASASLALRLGVPRDALILETKSTNTRENARNAAAICRKHGWSSVIAVSDPYHLWRVRRDFRLVGITAYTSPAYNCIRNKNFFMRVGSTIREGLAVLRDYITWN